MVKTSIGNKGSSIAKVSFVLEISTLADIENKERNRTELEGFHESHGQSIRRECFKESQCTYEK